MFRLEFSVVFCLVHQTVLLFVKNGTAGSPSCLASEQYKLIVHLNGRQENCILQRIAEVTENSFQLIILSISDLFLPLADVVKFKRNHGQQYISQLQLNFLLTLEFLQIIHFYCQYLVLVIVAIHVAG